MHLQIITDAGFPALFARIVTEHSVEWDGSKHVSGLTESAEAVVKVITRIADQAVSGAITGIGACWRPAGRLREKDSTWIVSHADVDQHQAISASAVQRRNSGVYSVRIPPLCVEGLAGGRP